MFGSFPNDRLPRLFNLNLFEFWMWVFLRNRVNEREIRTLPELKAINTRHTAKISVLLLNTL